MIYSLQVFGDQCDLTEGCPRECRTWTVLTIAALCVNWPGESSEALLISYISRCIYLSTSYLTGVFLLSDFRFFSGRILGHCYQKILQSEFGLCNQGGRAGVR